MLAYVRFVSFVHFFGTALRTGAAKLKYQCKRTICRRLELLLKIIAKNKN